MTARMAEASSTTLLTLGLFAALGDQLVDQTDILWDACAEIGLRLGDRLRKCLDVQALVVIDDNDRVPFGEFLPLPHFRRNDDSSRRVELSVVRLWLLPFHDLRAVSEAMGFNFDTATVSRKRQALSVLPRGRLS